MLNFDEMIYKILYEIPNDKWKNFHYKDEKEAFDEFTDDLIPEWFDPKKPVPIFQVTDISSWFSEEYLDELMKENNLGHYWDEIDFQLKNRTFVNYLVLLDRENRRIRILRKIKMKNEKIDELIKNLGGLFKNLPTNESVELDEELSDVFLSWDEEDVPEKEKIKILANIYNNYKDKASKYTNIINKSKKIVANINMKSFNVINGKILTADDDIVPPYSPTERRKKTDRKRREKK
jgi:hypothetical protein